MDVRQSAMARALRRAGYRLTSPRLAILRVLQENRSSLEPEDILDRARTWCPSLGLVTVYRTMDMLTELGLVRRLHSAGGCHGFAGSGVNRHPLVCKRCRRVVEFPCQGLDDLIEHVRDHTGFVISEHMVELVGLCPECQADQQSAER